MLLLCLLCSVLLTCTFVILKFKSLLPAAGNSWVLMVTHKPIMDLRSCLVHCLPLYQLREYKSETGHLHGRLQLLHEQGDPWSGHGIAEANNIVATVPKLSIQCDETRCSYVLSLSWNSPLRLTCSSHCIVSNCPCSDMRYPTAHGEIWGIRLLPQMWQC